MKKYVFFSFKPCCFRFLPKTSQRKMPVLQQITLIPLGAQCFLIFFARELCHGVQVVRLVSGPVVGSPELPLEGLQGAGPWDEVPENWPDLPPPSCPRCSCLTWGSCKSSPCKTLWGLLYRPQKQKPLRSRVAMHQILMPFKYLDACSTRNAFLFKIKVKF